LCITFVIAGNFDEITTKSELILFILKPKLRERKRTNNSWKHEKPKTRKHDHSWASAELFPGGEQRRHFVYHFQLADDQCSV